VGKKVYFCNIGNNKNQIDQVIAILTQIRHSVFYKANNDNYFVVV